MNHRNMQERELANIYTYHAPDASQIAMYTKIRNMGGDLADMINRFCLPCRELDQAMLKVEEAVMWANAAIARHGFRG
jgi:hypothetical protein